MPQFDPRALGARCNECPFNGQTPVPSTEVKGFRDFTILLEGPGGVEAIAGLPLSGKTGVWMEKVFAALHLDRTDLAIRNAMACAPIPLTSAAQFSAATACCGPRVLSELTKGPDRTRSGEIILAMGNASLKSLTGKSGIHDWRGYPLKALDPALQDVIVFPTFHPSFVMREPWYWPVLKLDLERALMMRDGKLKAEEKWPPIYVDDNEQSLDALDRIYSSSLEIGIDVETGGTEGPFTDPLLCVGVANKNEAVTVKFPFPDHLDGLVRAILESKKHAKVTQNGNHDRISLLQNGIHLPELPGDYDLLPASRIAFPQIDHDLGFIVSLLFFIPRWKSEFKEGKEKGSKGWLKAAKDPDRFRKMRIYNSKDAWTTVISAPRLKLMLERQPYGP